MTETKTPETTPSPKPVVTAAGNSRVMVGKPENPQSVFVGMALDMSWRLAIAVLVPIIGGFELDSHIGTTPLLTVVGFIIAMIGFGLVLWRTTQVANEIPAHKAVSVTPESNDKGDK